MKNVLRIVFLVVLLLVGNFAEASEGFGVRMTEEQVLLVELAETKQGAVLILEDKNGNILFRDSITSQGSYKKRLHLELIPKGIYYLNLEKENRILSTILLKNNTGVAIQENSSGIIFKPCYKIEKGKVKFFLTNPGEKNVRIIVYDLKGELIGSTSGSGAVIRKTFDFSGVPGGKYILHVKTENRSFLKKLTVG